MITSKFAAEQIQRMSGLKYFPKPKDENDREARAALKELRLALECAETESAAQRAVDEWVRVESDCPKPAQLRRMAYDANNEGKYGAQATGCAECDYTGWRIVIRGGLSGAKECECRKRAASA